MTDMPADRELRAEDLLVHAVGLARKSLHRAVIAAALIGGAGTVVDSGTLPEDAASALNLVLSFGGVFLQYWLIAALLDELGWNRPSGGRFGGYFVLGIVTMLGYLIGLVALIIPGIYLATRWSVAGPVLIASNKGIFEALGESWRMTRGHAEAIFLVMLAVYGPGIVLAIVGTMGSGLDGFRLAGVVAANAGFTLTTVGGSFLCVAIYSLVEPVDAVSAVFE